MHFPRLNATVSLPAKPEWPVAIAKNQVPDQKQEAAKTNPPQWKNSSQRNGAAQSVYRMDPFRHRQAPALSIDEDMKACFDSDQANKDPQAMRLRLLETGNPLFYLSTARGCQPIRKALVKIDNDPVCRQEVKAISDAIKRGDWQMVSHRHFEQFRQGDVRHGMHVKDALFHAFWKGDLCRAEFQTAINHLNIEEQVLNSIDPEYSHKGGKTRLPKIPGEVKLCRIFQSSSSTELTAEAEHYIGQIQKTFDAAGSERLPKKFDRAHFIRELRKIPENLQVFTRIENIKGADIAASQEVAWWFGELLHKNDAPVLGAEMSGPAIPGATVYGERGVGAHADDGDNPEIVASYAFHSPSYGVLQAFLLTQTQVSDSLAFRAVVQPVMCLNAVSSETETAMHSRMAHPVWAADVRTRSTLTHPHEVMSGPLLAEIGHDSGFHAPKITSMKPSARVASSVTLPAFVSALARTAIEEQIAKKINAELGDLAFHEIAGQPFLEMKLCDSLQKITGEELLADQKNPELTMTNIMAVNKQIMEFGNRIFHCLQTAEQDIQDALSAPVKKRGEKDANPFRSPYGRAENGERFFSRDLTHLGAVFSDEKLVQYKNLLAFMGG